MLASVLAISIGASLGAICRWGLAGLLNGLFPLIPMGTLSANLLGGYLIGFALCALENNSALGPEWRLCIVTGFLGSLTTFSSFSAEAALLVQQGRLLWTMCLIFLHVCGSLMMTFLGMGSFAALKSLLR